MNSENTFAWLVLIAVVAILYYPVVTRIFRRQKRLRALKKLEAQMPLLGVVWPPSDKKDE
jgi:Flp pilus assembly protein TadB